MPRQLNINTVSFNRMRSVFFFALIVILSIAMLYLFRPFLYPIFWAAVISVLFYPMYEWVTKWIRNKTFSSLITVLLVVIIIFIPLSALSALLVNESVNMYNKVASSGVFQSPEQVSSWLETTPFAPYIEQVRDQWTSYAGKAAQWLSNFLFQSIKSITQNSVRFLLMSIIMLYTLFYFFRDGKRLLSRVMHLSPLGDIYEEMLYERFTSTVRATLKSTLIVGGIQGTLAGFLFWITGVEGAFVWGVIMTVIAIIPAVGTPIIIIPAAIIMLALGNVWQAIVLIAGALFISTLDNIIRPPLVGKDIQMHPLIVFFATLGGIFIFGVSGFIIGPIIAALYISIMLLYDHYYKHQLENN